MASSSAHSAQGITWILFVVALVYLLLQGLNQAWLKTFAYLSTKATDADGDTLSAQANGRMLFLFTFYAYAYAYVRIIFFSIFACLVLILARLCFPAISSQEMLDPRNVFEFMHWRHWKAHGTALAVYGLGSLVPCMLLMGVPANASSKSEASREYTRITVLATSMLVLFYVSYAVGRFNCAKSDA